jgi:hypothetical protein
MRTLPLRRAIALSCLAFVLASPAGHAQAPAKPAPTAKLVPTPSTKQIRQNFAERQKELERQLRGEFEKARVEAAKCPEGRAGAACKQKAGKARAKPVAEIRRKIVIARLDQEKALSQAELRENLARLQAERDTEDYKAAQRKRLEAEAALRTELAMIQGETELAKLDCGNNDCRNKITRQKEAREKEARKRANVEPLQMEVRRLARQRRAGTPIVVGETPKP